MKNRSWLCLSVLILPLTTLAADMATLFPYAAQSHDQGGEVDMEGNSHIVGTRDGKLDFKKKDDLKGKCDDKACQISGEIVPAYPLPTFNTAPFTLPEFKTTNSIFTADCGGSGSIKYSRSEFEKVVTSGSCDIYLANDGDVVIDEELSAEGSGNLYLAPGNYWVESFSLSGDSKIVPTAAGPINLYVKKQVKLEGSSTLGSTDSAVNLFHYDDDNIKLEGGRTWFGNVMTRGELDIGGSSKLYGAVQAGSLHLYGSAHLYQTAGEYWFEDLELEGSAQLVTVGSRPSRFYVRDELELEGSAQLGREGQSLLLLVYGEQDEDGDDGEADLEGSSAFYGHLYLQGDLEMEGRSSIYGAVNVVDLEMQGSSAIYARDLQEGQSTAVHHYELHFNGCRDELTAYACANESCTEQYTDKAKLHVKANGSNLANFNNIYGSESQSIKKKISYPFTMVVQSGGNGGNMQPDADNPLVCYVNGEKTCTVTSASGGGDAGSFTFDVDTAYAGDKAAISFSGGCLSVDGAVEVQFGFDSVASGEDESVTLFDAAEKPVAALKAGETQTLTLPVTGAKISYPHADRLTLSVQQVLPESGLGTRLSDKVAFVPKGWRVQQAMACGEDSFIYSENAHTCTVLGAAGNELNFSVAALDVNGQPLPLGWLSGRMSTELIHASLENGALKSTSDYALNDDGDDATLSAHLFASDMVGRLQVKVDGWQADYIASGDTKLTTQGDSAYVGRTVPASLKVTPTAGDIADDVVYAGQPGVSFDTDPSFTVVGLDVDGKTLPSFSGEFAGGLEDNASLVINTSIDHALLEWGIKEKVNGEHLFTLDDDKLSFIKDIPFPETRLNLPLELSIGDHDGTQGVAANTTLAQQDDTLRFGFVTLMDTEIKVGETGSMASKLHYFGENTNTVLEDDTSGYSLSAEGRLSYEQELKPELQLTLAERDIRVQSYDKQKKNIEVTVENLPAWLKPEQDGSLTNPVALLDILNNPRLRASDSTFNRREVIR